MRKLVVTLLAALAVMLPALAITAAPAQAATASATDTPAPAPTAEEQAAADKAAADKAAAKKLAKEKAAKKKAALAKKKALARKKAAARKRAAQLRVWNQLAHCESTSRWAVNTGNGYYGGLQISPSTWRAFGGQRFAGLPHRASKSEQIVVGKRIKNGQGWGAWPSCSRRLGLR